MRKKLKIQQNYLVMRRLSRNEGLPARRGILRDFDREREIGGTLRGLFELLELALDELRLLRLLWDE
jgi:hypothetical protein